MPDNPAPLTDETGTLWFCPRCELSGVITFPVGLDVYSVVRAVKEAHGSECGSEVKVTRPENWYRDLRAKGRRPPQ
jgi:hypothetical protein